MRGFFYYLSSRLLTFSTLYNELSSEKKTKEKKFVNLYHVLKWILSCIAIPMIEDPSHV